jgi:hypothetical protein
MVGELLTLRCSDTHAIGRGMLFPSLLSVVSD